MTQLPRRRWLLAPAAALALLAAGCGGGGAVGQDILDLEAESSAMYNPDPDDPVAEINVANESEHMDEVLPDDLNSGDDPASYY